MMQRREALKALAVITGGAVLVPSCDFTKEEILAAYNKLQVTPSLLQLLAEVADTIIPAGSLKGASDINVHDFILVMVNDCMNEENQQAFMKGLSNFDAYSKKTGGRYFDKLNPEEKASVVTSGLALTIQESADNSGNSEEAHERNIVSFLRTTKRFTIQGFMASEYMQREIKPVNLIPGKYNGAVLLTDIKQETIHG